MFQQNLNKMRMPLKNFFKLLYKQTSHYLPEQLLYSRFVNTRGAPAAYISINLHVEHIYKVVKSSVYSQMSNLSSKSVVRTSRCTGTLFNVVEQFDRISGLHHLSSVHSKAELDKDIHCIVTQLHNTSKVFQCFNGRQHAHFKSIQGSIVNSIKADKDRFIKWMNDHLKNSLS